MVDYFIYEYVICRLSVRFAVKTDQAYLFSYPRSGNSWTRYLIEAATGVFTGSLYKDKRSADIGKQVLKELSLIFKVYVIHIPVSFCAIKLAFEHKKMEPRLGWTLVSYST